MNAIRTKPVITTPDVSLGSLGRHKRNSSRSQDAAKEVPFIDDAVNDLLDGNEAALLARVKKSDALLSETFEHEGQKLTLSELATSLGKKDLAEKLLPKKREVEKLLPEKRVLGNILAESFDDTTVDKPHFEDPATRSQVSAHNPGG